MRGRLARAAWGALLLTAPGRLLELGGGADTSRVRAAAQLLGARHLAEAVVLRRSGHGRVRRWTFAVDAIHGVSMLAVAVASRRLRRDALLSAAATGCLTAFGLRQRASV